MSFCKTLQKNYSPVLSNLYGAYYGYFLCGARLHRISCGKTTKQIAITNFVRFLISVHRNHTYIDGLRIECTMCQSDRNFIPTEDAMLCSVCGHTVR